ncbi:MAG: carbonic anhydrase [Haliangiales bacterium]
MQKLIAGLREFMSSVHARERAFFEELATGQQPEVLFVTCSDSRVVPSVFTQTKPGDLFTIRNVGNIIPPISDPGSAEAAAIEFAVRGLTVKDVVVCGHSDCGAMQGLLAPEKLVEMPAVASWLRHTDQTERILNQRYGDTQGRERLRHATELNVMVQLAHLAQHRSVAERLADGSLRVHGWVYDIGSGTVSSFDSEAGEFVPVAAKDHSMDGLRSADLDAVMS